MALKTCFQGTKEAQVWFANFDKHAGNSGYNDIALIELIKSNAYHNNVKAVQLHFRKAELKDSLTGLASYRKWKAAITAVDRTYREDYFHQHGWLATTTLTVQPQTPLLLLSLRHLLLQPLEAQALLWKLTNCTVKE
ncbi:hypothetical protein FA15DRAFT_658601 [Coprinopsis marcescibilis]|uniref:Uncharacterized protein n=1 Tax=Coprinopsis marcescibilis TaxID=230819 RepID=A0A5C3KM33_COPMA|nr:hypothetical protein FA15DRAFT_658601 [Coprinopsis marcescibilis]